MTINNNQNTPFLLVELLESFSKKEIKGLRQLINCDYFNKDKQVINLLEILIKKVIGKNKSNIQIQCTLFNQVFDETFKNTELTKKQKSLLSAKMSILTKLSKQFLTIEALENSKVNKSDLVLNTLLKKKQFRLFEKQLKEECKILNENKGYEYYEHLMIIEEVKLHYLYQSGKWMKDDNLNELMNLVNIKYLNDKLIYTTTALAFSESKLSTNYDLSILKILKSEYFRQYQSDKFPSLKIRIAVVELMLNKTTNAYNHLLITLKKNESKLSDIEIKNIYLIIIYFCDQQIKKGYTEYLNNYVVIYKILDAKGLIETENNLQAAELKNIVEKGCKVSEFEWVQKMIEKYISLVDLSIRKNVRNFCFGYLAFRKKEFELSIDYLSKMDNFSLYFDLEKRIILIKSYFELGKCYSIPIAQLFRSFEAFVHNHKLIRKKTKVGYKNFIRVALNLYRLKHKIGIIKIETLKTIVEKATHIKYKNWLLDKIKHLEGHKYVSLAQNYNEIKTTKENSRH